MENEMLGKLNYDELMELRKALIHPEKLELLKNILNDMYMEGKPTIIVNDEIKDELKNYDITRLYLNTRSENALIEHGCSTIFDLTDLDDLTLVRSLGESSIKNIRINMSFVEQYLLDEQVRIKNGNNDNDFSKKYSIIFRNEYSIFKYLENKGQEFIFANNDCKNIKKAHKLLTCSNVDKLDGKEKYRILKCLADYSFLDEIEGIDRFDPETYKSFNKFIVKRK